jgi:hypothetical protein
MTKTEDRVQIDEHYIPTEGEDEIKSPISLIPEKFRHIDLQQLSQASGEIEELKQTLSKIHPWSSLHYGLSVRRTFERPIRW